VIWLTWRQQRLETLVGLGLVMAVVAFLLKTGIDLASAYRHLGVASCLAHDPAPGGCQTAIDAFETRFSSAAKVILWTMNFLPLLIGVLLAAPLVLELEHGTYRLTWTQSVTRDRWLAVRLGLVTGAALLSAFALTALMTWWNAPQDHIQSRLFPNQFEFEGIVPIAYTVFAASLCLAVGSVLRRALPAVGITLIAYVPLRGIIGGWLRYHYLAPVTKYFPFDSGGSGGPLAPSRADYFMSATASIPKPIMRLCFGGTLNPPPPNSAAGRLVPACFSHHGVFASVIYQPGSRFWLFQGIESAIYLVPAIALLALAAWWIRYRVT
jgi:hypothetical protein